MVRVSVDIGSDISAQLDAIGAQLANPVAMYKDCGRRVANDLRQHFAALEAAQAPQHGAMSTHFWEQIRNATGNPVMEGNGVSVTIADPRFAQKLFGGTIVAKNAEALTIPIDPRAHGRRASVFEQETGYKLFHPLGTRLLMADIDGQATPIYALVQSVTQEPDPEALPSDEELNAGIMDTATKHLARTLGGSAT